jgi:hypothetical protein
MDLNGDNTPEFWTHTNGTTGTLVYYKTIDGANDTDTYIKFAGGTPICYNANCHGGSASPAWNGASDTTPPTVATVRVNGSARTAPAGSRAGDSHRRRGDAPRRT